MGRRELVGRCDGGRQRQDPRGHALDCRQRDRRRSGQRLDVLERRIQSRQQIDRAADGQVVLAQNRFAQRPAIARQLQPPGRIEPLRDGGGEGGHRIRPFAAELLVLAVHLREQTLEAEDIRCIRPSIRHGQERIGHRSIRLVEPALLAQRRLGLGTRVDEPFRRQDAFVAFDRGQRGAEQRGSLGGRVDQPRGGEDVLDGFLRRQRRQKRLNHNRRIGHGGETQTEAAGAGRGAQVGNRLVEHAEHLPDFGLAVVVVALRPLGQHLARMLDNGKAPRRIAREGDLVERRGDVVRKRGVIGFSAGLQVPGGARAGGIALGALPVDPACGNVDEMQRRIRSRLGGH